MAWHPVEQGQTRKALFARYITKGFGQDKAAVLAGYSPKAARETGYKLMRDPFVKKQIDLILQRMDEASEIDMKSHLRKLAELREIAVDKGQMGAAVAAEVSRGKAARLYVDSEEGRFRPHETAEALVDKLIDRATKLHQKRIAGITASDLRSPDVIDGEFVELPSPKHDT